MHQQTPELRGRTSLSVHAARVAKAFAARRGRGLLVAALGGLFMSAVGAFGSAEAPPILRTFYWVLVMTSGGLLGGIIAEVFLDRGWFDDRRWLQVLAMTAAMTAPLTVVVWALTALTFGDPWRVERMLVFLPAVAIVSLAMTALNFLIEREPPATHAAAPGAPPVRFLERLPFKLKGAELYAVEAEDHYLRLHTSRGSDLILLRLTDAVAELEGIEGAQTHRSWWVARAAVQAADRADGRATLTLPGGVQAPVSRTYAKALREAGWF